MSTLDELIGRVALELGDPENDVWTEDELAVHIRRALEAVSRADPQRLDAVIESQAGVREYPLDDLGAFWEVTDLWYPYDPDDPAHAPQRPEWFLILSKTFYLGVEDEPTGEGTAQIRVFYTAPHAIEDLDGAAATTLDAAGEGAVCLGAAAYAVEARAHATIGRVTVSPETAAQYAAWAEARMARFEAALRDIRRRRVASPDARVAVRAMV